MKDRLSRLKKRFSLTSSVTTPASSPSSIIQASTDADTRAPQVPREDYSVLSHARKKKTQHHLYSEESDEDLGPDLIEVAEKVAPKPSAWKPELLDRLQTVSAAEKIPLPSLTESEILSLTASSPTQSLLSHSSDAPTSPAYAEDSASEPLSLQHGHSTRSSTKSPNMDIPVSQPREFDSFYVEHETAASRQNSIPSLSSASAVLIDDKKASSSGLEANSEAPDVSPSVSYESERQPVVATLDQASLETPVPLHAHPALRGLPTLSSSVFEDVKGSTDLPTSGQDSSGANAGLSVPSDLPCLPNAASPSQSSPIKESGSLSAANIESISPAPPSFSISTTDKGFVYPMKEDIVNKDFKLSPIINESFDSPLASEPGSNNDNGGPSVISVDAMVESNSKSPSELGPSNTFSNFVSSTSLPMASSGPSPLMYPSSRSSLSLLNTTNRESETMPDTLSNPNLEKFNEQVDATILSSIPEDARSHVPTFACQLCDALIPRHLLDAIHEFLLPCNVLVMIELLAALFLYRVVKRRFPLLTKIITQGILLKLVYDKIT